MIWTRNISRNFFDITTHTHTQLLVAEQWHIFVEKKESQPPKNSANLNRLFAFFFSKLQIGIQGSTSFRQGNEAFNTGFSFSKERNPHWTASVMGNSHVSSSPNACSCLQVGRRVKFFRVFLYLIMAGQPTPP